LKRVATVLAFAAAFAPAQTGGPAAVVFEVASVKLAGPQSQRGSSGGPGTSDPERYSYRSADLQDLIAIAYDVDYFQISSKVPLEQNRFDLVAKIPSGTTKEQFRVMLQNLTIERFHLRAHVESREYPAYELVIAKGGPRLPDAAAGASTSQSRSASQESEFPELPPDRPGLASRHTVNSGNLMVRMRARQEPLSAFADWLQPPDRRKVVDKTGLSGTYDFTFEYSYPLPGAVHDVAEPSAIPDLFTALQQQLGLQLVNKKLPFRTVVVESVDKLPAENE
jgi:uncharacterized protein (TIGR03435 family)